MELERRLLTAEMIAPDTGEIVRTPIEVRVDPLTGHTSRILPNRGLMPPNDFDLEAFARENQPRCPFCPERIETLTPRLPPAIHPDGRITHGEAVLFPNLHAYSSHSCVSVYSPRLHYLPLEQITDRLMADNLRTQVTYDKAVMAADPESRWASINANHMLPSGSSLFHPHLQGIVDSEPTTMQRLLAAVPATRFEAYLRAERRAGERVLGNTGRVEWLVSFAPIAPAELRAFVEGVASPVELEDDLIEELAHGLTLTLERVRRHGLSELQSGDLRRAARERRVSAESAHRLPLEPQAVTTGRTRRCSSACTGRAQSISRRRRLPNGSVNDFPREPESVAPGRRQSPADVGAARGRGRLDAAGVDPSDPVQHVCDLLANLRLLEAAGACGAMARTVTEDDASEPPEWWEALGTCARTYRSAIFSASAQGFSAIDEWSQSEGSANHEDLDPGAGAARRGAPKMAVRDPRWPGVCSLAERVRGGR